MNPDNPSTDSSSPGTSTASLSFSAALKELLPALDDIQLAWEEDANELRKVAVEAPFSTQFTCKKGCGACCHFPIVPSTAGEAFVLLARLLGEGKSLENLQSQFSTYSERYFAHARAQGSLPFTEAAQKEFLNLKMPCPLFVKDDKEKGFAGACGVFGGRPLVCDYYHSLEAPALCAEKKLHAAFEPLMERGMHAVEEVREKERSLFGRSALGHLPLLLAALCTQQGMEAFLRIEIKEKSEDDQALADFEYYEELLAAAGYKLTRKDLEDLAKAQEDMEKQGAGVSLSLNNLTRE